jgi:uncharacterized protein (TIGR04255 family)
MSVTSGNGTGLRYTLAKPAIELAVAEVRFVAPSGSVTEEIGVAFREAIRRAGLAMDGFEPVFAQEIKIDMGAQGGTASSTSASQGWVCRDTETGMAVTVMPFSVSVQTNRYTRWSETLQPYLTAALEAAADLLAPTLRNRIGLRYVNRFGDPSARTLREWAPRFVPEFLGPTAAGPLADLVKSSQQLLELHWGDGLAGTLRHGAFVDPALDDAYSYLLDLDVFDQATEPFVASQCLERATAMNRRSAELFKSVLSDDHLELRGLSVETSEGAE